MQFYTPLEYLKIDIANCFGLDKEQFEDRITWTDMNLGRLEDFIDKADNKYLYAAAVMALRDVQAGLPTGYLVGFDACSQGPQIMSAVMRDITGAKNTSLVGNKRNDLYTLTTDLMNSYLKGNKQYDRSYVKRPIMTRYYGSKAEPIKAFGDGTPEYEAFIKASNETCPGAATLMPILIGSWKPFAKNHYWVLPDGFECNVKVTVLKKKIIEIDELNHLKFTQQYHENEGVERKVSNMANVIQSIDGLIVREICRRCNYDKWNLQRVLRLLKQRSKQKGKQKIKKNRLQELWKRQKMVSLVAVESIDEYSVRHLDLDYCKALIELIQRCLSRPSFPVICVHDAFRVHPNYANWVRMTYMELMAEISDSEIIDDILSQLFGQPVYINKLANSISTEIMNGEYAIC